MAGFITSTPRSFTGTPNSLRSSTRCPHPSTPLMCKTNPQYPSRIPPTPIPTSASRPFSLARKLLLGGLATAGLGLASGFLRVTTEPADPSSTKENAKPTIRIETRAESAQASPSSSRFLRKSLAEKLGQVPVFAVTNAQGQPYLANVDGIGHQIGLIFFSHEDALKMLEDMKKNPGASDARVYIMGLDKAYEMVRAKPTPSGIRGQNGEELKMVFRFYPDSKQVKHAKNILRKSKQSHGGGGSTKVDGIPVFVAKGLALKRGSENVIPVFLTKEDLDQAWENLRLKNNHLPKHASVEVGNLLFIVSQMEKGDHPELKNLGFFAPKASVEYSAKVQAGPTGQARMHQNPIGTAKK